MSLEISMQERQTCFFQLTLAGRLDTMTAPQLEQRVAMLIQDPVKALVLDMANLEYISSMGLRVVLKTMRDVQAKGGVFMVSNMRPEIQRVFEIAKLIPDDSFFTSVEEADHYFDAIQQKVRSGGPAPAGGD
ncbi:MAG: STAS domain-containing protein [Elusimicrobia bacterium]|nr:STAS domain-containing protein [Elusimicrobiota bacterium]